MRRTSSTLYRPQWQQKLEWRLSVDRDFWGSNTTAESSLFRVSLSTGIWEGWLTSG